MVDGVDVTAGAKYEDATDGSGMRICSVAAKATLACRVELRKHTYFPYRRTFSLDGVSFSGSSDVDLGRIGLLNEIKEDAFVLTWGEKPADLDSRLACPNGETVGVSSAFSDETRGILHDSLFANVSTDSINGYGPETLTVRKWADLGSSLKVGGHYEFYVHWYMDERG